MGIDDGLAKRKTHAKTDHIPGAATADIHAAAGAFSKQVVINGCITAYITAGCIKVYMMEGEPFGQLDIAAEGFDIYGIIFRFRQVELYAVRCKIKAEIVEPFAFFNALDGQRAVINI